MRIEHRSPTVTPAALAAVLTEDGCVVVDGLAPSTLMDRIDGELAPYLERAPVGPHDHMGRRTRRTGALVARSAGVRTLVADRLTIGCARTVLAAQLQLHLTQLIDIGPGESAQDVHCDQWEFDFDFPPEKALLCNVMWALTDFTEENGATRIVPGSNRWPDRREVSHNATIPVEMSRGSALFYTGSVYHGGGANRSDQHRRGINIGYSLSWLRQEENQYLSCPPEIARTLSPGLQGLIGYSMSGDALGYFNDVQHPADALYSG